MVGLDSILPVIILILLPINLGIFGTWVYLLAYMIKSFRHSPTLDCSNKILRQGLPKVSIILPARNEEKYISKCLDSLIQQDYPNFEIIVINDSSDDGTWDIIQKYASSCQAVTALNAAPKPEGWAGKNWACYQGYLKANGDLFLFTDADTVHSSSIMSLATAYMLNQKLDAITVIPKLICKNFWTKITLPMLSTFLHTRFSALRVNSRKFKTGYFFGSFYIISRTTYESIGTHESVRQELVEDGALGAKVKRQNFSIKMVRGERHIEAIWAHDLETLWHALRRLMIPLYSQNNHKTIMMITALIFLLLEPFLLLAFSIWLSLLQSTALQTPALTNSFHSLINILIFTNISTVIVILVNNAIQSKSGVFQNPIYAVACPMGAAIISASFISSVIDARKKDAISWRGRQYTIEDSQHPLN
jgi:chlorobactene glucosyltransferase